MIKQVFTYSDGISCVHATEEGLWLGHQGGASFLDPGSGSFAKWTTADGLPAHPVLHVTSAGSRLAMATPNGVAWSDEVQSLLHAAISGQPALRWNRGLMHPRGAGAYVNGVAFVDGKIYASTGGGRIYLEGDTGFQLLELPLRQARLLRVLPLETSPGTKRLLLVTNNSGILLLATGAGEEPSLYQWGEEEGLCSRYVTSIAAAGKFVAVGVHGCIHVAKQCDLVQAPEDLSRWGRVILSDLQGPAEHSRIHSLCEHGEYLYAGTSVGLYRISLIELEIAAQDRVAAQRVDDGPVRHLVSFKGELWAVQHSGLGKYLEGSAATVHRQPAESAAQLDPVSRGPVYRGRGRYVEAAPVTPRITSYGRRWRFISESRWRGFSIEPECRQIVCLASTPEGLVVGGEAGRVVLHVGERWLTEIIARQRRPPEVHSIVHDPDSATFWAATRHGLFHRDSRGRWSRDLSFPGRTVHELAVWAGNMVALGSAGLHVYVQSAWSEIPFADDTPALFSTAAGEDGLVLAGRPGGGFYIWRPDAQHPVPLPLPVGRANCMAWDGAGSLWLGTDRGLARWDDGDLETFAWSEERGDHITALLVHQGRLYIGSQAGVWTVPVSDLKPAKGEALESQGQRLGLLEGIPNPHVTCMAVHAGQVWVGTQGGLALLE
ncbi:MAG: hypothetical protein ACE5G2_09950 [Candidatus Krumholzibacteriia bacterium]